ncbi:uncharacterized protein KQ657_004798 [Scheffersomyces spartinae]|uniref:Uncharacterized protein n=1 Tax=Scheffersomyces spartinae TaxID=45513 RepID=A0A9P7VA99_9ASCO|nr:uncharacterized protein KQ657_004798 [Scheffersomyces spartinae]KAG7194090.1 hypothetical protein KQ657_004798 [Scheffersomyces spartinae]
MDLIGRKAVITGASRGLGAALSYKLASLGCSVTLVARNKTLLNQQLNRLPVINQDQKHEMLLYDLMNLISDTDLKKSPIVNHLNQVSILVNCAGVTTHSLLARISEQDIKNTVNLDLVVPMLLSKLAYKQLFKLKHDPSILNVSSVLSITGQNVNGTSIYSASKAGLLGFTQALAHELRDKVRVNSLLPALIRETDMGSMANVGSNQSLHTISLQQVVDKAVEIITDPTINGKFVVADNEKLPIQFDY